jgi:arginase family enzyme
VWLDGHGDLNTPETTETGYFDGYARAMVIGDFVRDRELAALTLSAYDQSYDDHGTVRDAALAALRAATRVHSRTD